MGVLADAALEEGGEVVGVIPEALVARELAHANLTQLHVVGSMHERKALMADLSDGFVRPNHRSLVLTGEDPELLLDRMKSYTPPETKKWIELEER